MGTWIETEKETVMMKCRAVESFPLWERGLKQETNAGSKPTGRVVPLVGTWIETAIQFCAVSTLSVVPLVGTWIETNQK